MQLAILLLLSSAMAAWGIGGREDSLAYVDRLITNQRYDEAILYLSDFMKKNPGRFDEAQKQMQRITRIRSAYNKSATALIEVLRNDPMNQEKKLAIIAELESYEKAPNPAIREFVEKTKELALFTYNQAKFEEIMSQGRFLIDSRRFADAARLYETGFALYRPEFNESSFDRAIVDGAFERVATVSGEIIRFADQGAALNDAFAEFASACETSDDAAIAGAWDRSRAVAAEFLALRKSIVDQGRALEAAFVDIAANDPTITDNSFLPFAFRFVLGRKTESRLEGVVGSIDAQWINALGIAQARLEGKVAGDAGTALSAYDRGDWNNAASGFSGAARAADRGAALLSLWGSYVTSDLIERSTPLGKAALELKGADFLKFVHSARVARAMAGLSAIQAGIQAASAALAEYRPSVDWADKPAVLAAIGDKASAFAAAERAIESLRAESETASASLIGWSEAGYGSMSSLAELSALDNRLATALARARTERTQAVAAAAAWEYGRMADRSAAARSLVEQASRFLDGVPSGDPEYPSALARYPLRAQELLGEAVIAFRALRADIGPYLASYGAKTDPANSAPAVQEWASLAGVLAADAEKSVSIANTLLAKAKEQKRLADLNKIEAERRVIELLNALRSNNFMAAKDRLNLARDRYLAALSYEYDQALRAESDAKLADLAARIRKTENELVVSEARQFLTRGKSLYAQGEFERAESSFLQARLRWGTTNAKPDFEIEYWLTLVQNAMTVKTGRSIPVTSPLFPETSQILALARRYFDEGAALLAKRDRPGAIKLFAQAKQKIAEVKVVFPLNQEASILDLKIDQLSDPDEFGKKFIQMFNDAKARVDSGTDLTSAYNDLKDLEAIQPRYPGLGAAIEKAETRIGVRQRQPDQYAVSEARSLVQSAQRIFDEGQPSRYPEARAQLERALLLDPENQSISALKDRIATSAGGDTAIVLPSAAELLYLDAAAALNAGDYAKARERLNQLAASFSQGLSMPKVRDLDAKLKAKGF